MIKKTGKTQKPDITKIDYWLNRKIPQNQTIDFERIIKKVTALHLNGRITETTRNDMTHTLRMCRALYESNHPKDPTHITLLRDIQSISETIMTFPIQNTETPK